MRIIVIEPDAALGVFLQKGLNIDGHDVSWASQLEGAMGPLVAEAVDLLIADVSGPGGVYLLEAVRKLGGRIAVLTLTSNHSVEHRIQCLDLGADDCMTKPFSFQELTARTRALLRRLDHLKDGEAVLAHEGLRLDRIHRSAAIDGRPITLTAKEFKLLEFLLQNAGRCCSRSQLLLEVFQLPAENATNVVDVYINYLRKKLGTAAGSPRIVTVRGAGYSLARSEPKELVPMALAGSDLYATA